MRFSLDVPGSRSLKDKRSVVRSAKERIQGRLKVSIAEIGVLDDPRRATLGVAVVSNSHTVCDQVMSSVMSIASTLPDAVLTDRATEIVSFGDGGRGIQGGIEQLFSTSNDDDEGGSP
ncbi:MAG TPA: DUF503 domain-containing protein [Polyangium sp.]|nr:DUF503 domain-containing protein [Polyangium sp.]